MSDLGNSKEATPVALQLAFFDVGGFSAPAPSNVSATWQATGAGATVAPSADMLSAVVTPSSTGQITITASVSGTNSDGSAFSGSASSTVEVVSGVAVTVAIVLAPPAAPAAPAA